MNTVDRECRIEFEERKSKFIGYVKPISTKLEAEEYIDYIKMFHPTATHNCSAYKVVSDGQEYYKVDDDGEPSGTAGKPMGEILNLLQVNNLVVVATRYYGGIKLGAGGLVRNYAKTAKLAVEEAGIKKYVERRSCVLDFAYDRVQDVDRILEDAKIENIQKEYLDTVTYRVELEEDTIEKLRDLRSVVVVEL